MLAKLKGIVAKILCNSISGEIIGFILNNKIPFFSTITVLTDSSFISPYIKSLLFWRIYEGAEAKYVMKFINDEHDIVELGSSLGVIASLAGKYSGNKKIVCVEINSDLIPVIEKNLIYNKVENYSIQNIAIGDSVDLWFTPGLHSSHGQVGQRVSDKSIKIKAVTLSELLKIEQITDYKLICDIEGSEIDILLSDPQSLKNCHTIIIETHKTERNGQIYQPADMKEIIINLGFVCVEERDVNYVFSRI